MARRYRRLERPLRAAVVVPVVGLAAGAILLLPLAVGLVVTVGAVGAVSVPIFRTGGTVRLTSNAGPASVLADFEGPTPPVLAFQWGIADRIDPIEDGARYEFSYLFGRRSAEMWLDVRRLGSADGGFEQHLELTVTADGHAWGTYEVSVREDSGESIVDVEWSADRRFPILRLSQWYAAERLRTESLTAQGYDVVERDATLTL